MRTYEFQVRGRAFLAFLTLVTFALMGGSVMAASMPKECDTFCSGNGGKNHPLCAALQEEEPKGAVLSDDSPEVIAETGLPKECQTFCNTPGGAGHALCAGATKVAATTTNTGGTGLMVNENYGKNAASTAAADDQASRLSKEQAAEAAALGVKTNEVVKAVEKRLKTAEQLAEEALEAKRRRYTERGESEKRKKMGEHGVEMED